jgi:hypothetical protein
MPPPKTRGRQFQAGAISLVVEIMGRTPWGLMFLAVDTDISLD